MNIINCSSIMFIFKAHVITPVSGKSACAVALLATAGSSYHRLKCIFLPTLPPPRLSKLPGKRMPIGLIFRGATFELRKKAARTRHIN